MLRRPSPVRRSRSTGVGLPSSRDEASHIAALLERGAALKITLASQPAPIIAVVDACEASIRAGNKLMFCGNGGSAADSQHLATELLIRLRGSVARDSWPAIALTLDPAALTACGNDFGFEDVFARPLSGLGRAGDVLFGITTSGRSPSVLRALETARRMGIVTVGLLGGDGGGAPPLCDHSIVVPDSETARVQECHIALGHVILELLEDRLTGKQV